MERGRFERSRKLIIGALIALIVVVAIFMVLKYDKGHHFMSDGVTLMSAETKYDSYSVVTDFSGVYLLNGETGHTSYLRKASDKQVVQMELTEDKAIDKPGKNLENECGLKKLDINGYYSSDINTSTVYMKSLEKLGWKTITKFSCDRYIDTYLQKDKDYKRVLITIDTLRVFDGAKPSDLTAMEFIKDYVE